MESSYSTVVGQCSQAACLCRCPCVCAMALGHCSLAKCPVEGTSQHLEAEDSEKMGVCQLLKWQDSPNLVEVQIGDVLLESLSEDDEKLNYYRMLIYIDVANVVKKQTG